MKTNRICKSTVSLLLVFMMLMSMLTVGIVNAGAAETDVAETGATITGGTTFYLKADFWDASDATERYAAFFCNGSSTEAWYSAEGPNDDGYYWVTVNSGESHANIIWCRMNGAATANNWDNKWNQTGDIVWDGTSNLFTISQWDGQTSGWSTYTPTDTPSGDPTTLKKLYFMDNSSDGYMTDEDADIYAKFDNESKAKAMKQRVDTISGKTLWSIKVPDGASSVVFTRRNKLGSTLGSGTWSVPLSDKTSGYFKGAGSGSGSWENDESTFSPSSDDDIANFWYGVWVDTKGEGNGTDAVRWWKDSSGKYHIFLPTHTPDTFKLYTSFDSFAVNNVTASKNNPVDISSITYDTSYSYTSSAGNGTIVFHKSANVSSLMLFTDDQLWTDTIYSSISDVSGYKDGIETKGNIYLYDKDGNLVNNVVTDEEDQTVLKKIKGRGNSSFEASMRMYGKYAYNFNLDERVSLVDGATATKKWCLLANNVDHSMLRNTFAYNLANDIGLAYSPKTRHVDVFDNGEYIGAYTIIEKVEYGKKTLMNGLVSLDDEHEAWYEDYNASIGNEDFDDYDKEAIKSVGSSSSPQTYTAPSGKVYNYKYWTSDIEGFTYEHADDTFKTEFNFLLEHELSDRYYNEASWFQSPYTGQYVVVKYPEFATQKEMKWAMDMYDKLEKAAYETNTLASIEAAADAESFAKVYLIQELGLNLDSCATSYYIYNDRAANKLVAGPVWDYDWSFGSYHKTKITYNGTSSSLDNPRQMFVKYKDINNNNSGGQSGKRNLQAQLTTVSDYWTLCKEIWTNDVEPAIKTYVDEDTADSTDTGIILGWMNDIEASAEMNNIRWDHTYENDEDEDWGTKLTSNYNKGSYDFKEGTGNSSGSATKAFKNTVYYLNDWLKTRMDYMSDDGGLYDESLLNPYELKSVTLNTTQSGANVTVSVDFDATYNDVQITNDYKRFELYVNGKLEGDYAITDTPVITLGENEETSFYVIAYLRDDKDAYNMTSDTKKLTYVVTGPEYKVENVEFTAVQSDNEATVTITPSATVTADGVAVPAQYTIYLNGAVLTTETFEKMPSYEVSLVEGKVNEIYIKVSPVADTTVSGTSITQKFSYNVPVDKVAVTINFKSSSSYRYIPKIKVGDNEAVAMTQKADGFIGKNSSQTQSYYWYTAEVEVEKDAETSVVFTNAYALNGSTKVVGTENAEYYLAVDNLNDGATVVDLTEFNTTDGEYILNFCQSASHMVYSSADDPEVAQTSIDGTTYKLGDVTGDGKTNISDATTMQLALAEKETLTETGEDLADFNLDTQNSIMDVTLFQNYIAR
ncbi:MAG: CotH kinase family protein [Ruminococcus sp.]|nr:CotH kinase family protein [Ruminococcus sp.]